jgi:hypothetical protein
MSITTESTTRRSVWLHGVVAALVAAAVTTGAAAVASALGVSFEVKGEAIPLLGFAELTLIFSVIGLGIAAIIARKAAHPRQTWIRTSVALVLLSFVPDATFGFDLPSALTLMGLHALAAAIVIPLVASRLND